MGRAHWMTVESSALSRSAWAVGTELAVARNSAPGNEAVELLVGASPVHLKCRKANLCSGGS